MRASDAENKCQSPKRDEKNTYQGIESWNMEKTQHQIQSRNRELRLEI